MNYLLALEHTHILRLTLDKHPQYDTAYSFARDFVLESLPLVWVIDDDYILISETDKIHMNKISEFSPKYLSSTKKVMYMAHNDEDSGGWKSSLGSERGMHVLNAVQHMSTHELFANHYRLDILLEDYLDEAWYYNKWRFRSGGTGQPMPTVDCEHILHLPHNIRLDLAAILTCTVLFVLPTSVNDCVRLFMILSCLYLFCTETEWHTLLIYSFQFPYFCNQYQFE